MDLNTSDRFEIVCKHKDTNPSNLNKLFSKYGCNTLEAKVPVVNDKVVEKLKTANYEQQSFGALALKSESASNAMEGRPSRTRNRPLSLVGIGRDLVISAGQERERSPVDRDELDTDLEEYMRVTAKLRAEKKAREVVPKLEPGVRRPEERLFAIPDVANENLSIEALLDNMRT